jgi:hypothetical protein
MEIKIQKMQQEFFNKLGQEQNKLESLKEKL